ncbi:MAG: PVC-type heme-binding CxxCH protein [Pirellulaceae bacterium]
MPALLLLACSLVAADIAQPQVLDDRLQLQLVAAEPDVVTPTGLAVDDQGRVLVIESHTHFRPPGYEGPQHDRILRLEDFDPASGKARKRSIFFEGTTYTMSLAVYHDGSIYVATRNEIFRLRDTDDDGQADERKRICHLETTGNYPHNGLSGFAFDFAGNIYFGFGENLGADYKLIGSDGKSLAGGGEGGNIYCCDPAGKNVRRVATGFWNPFHLTFDAFGRLFAVDNDPDSRPPCRLLHIVEGGDYGYRFRHGRKGVHPFTAWNGELPGTLPMVAGTGEAPCAVLAYESDNLPAEYRGDLLVTSWGDHRLERYRLKPRGASFSAEMTPLVRGDENFRPVGMALAPDGSLFFSDWVDKSYHLHGKGRVWRLSAKNPPERAEPRDDWEAIESLHGPTREAASRRLAAQGGSRKMALAILLDSKNEAVQAAAVRTIPVNDFYGQSLLLGLVGSHPSAGVRTAIVDRLRIPTSQTDLRQVPFDRQTYATLTTDESMPPETIAQVLVSTDLRSAPLALPYDGLRSQFDGYESQGESPPSPPRVDAGKFWGSLERDPFLSHAVSVAMAADIRQWRARPEAQLRRRRGRDDLARMDSPHLQQRIAFANAARLSGQVKLAELVPELLTDTDPTLQLVGLRWIAETSTEEATPLRWRVERLLENPAVTRQVFEAALATLDILDRGEDYDPKAESAGDAYVAKILKDEAAAPAVRRFALRSLPADHPSVPRNLLAELLVAEDSSLRLEAIRTIRQQADADRWPELRAISQNSEKPALERCEALLALSPVDPDDRKLLLELTSDPEPAVADEAFRALRGIELTDAEKTQLAELAATLDGPRKELAQRTLTKDLPQKLPPPCDQAAWLKLAEGEGIAAAGERLFYHPRVAMCFRCHEFEGRGDSIGPDLTNIGRTLTRERLVQSIVDPSREIAPMFTNWSILTTGGQTLTGVHVGDEVDGRIKFADQNGRIFHVHPNDIDRRQPSPQSIMPAGLAESLTAQELRDLLAFLLEKQR